MLISLIDGALVDFEENSPGLQKCAKKSEINFGNNIAVSCNIDSGDIEGLRR